MAINGLALCLSLLFVTACADETAPGVVVVTTDAPAHVLDDAITAWSALGFHEGSDSDAECAADWFVTGDVDCSIFISVEMDDTLIEEYRVGGLADVEGRRIWLYPAAENLHALVAHEFGHVLLNTSEHIAGRPAVMNGGPGLLHATVADYQLACRTIGLCLPGTR